MERKNRASGVALLVVGLVSLASLRCPPEPPGDPAFTLQGCRDLDVGDEISLVLTTGDMPAGAAHWSIVPDSDDPGQAILSGANDSGATLKALGPGRLEVRVDWVENEGDTPDYYDFCEIVVSPRSTTQPPVEGPTCTTSKPPENAEIYEPAGGQVCDHLNVLTTGDGHAVAGLARLPTVTLIDLDEMPVSSCIRVDFGESIAARQLRSVAKGVQEICGDGCIAEACDTGHRFLAFGSVDGNAYTFLGTTNISTDLRAYALDIDSAVGEIRYVLVCRSGDGHGRDNIAIDYVELCL